MRIAIDYRPAINQAAGIGRYTRGLIGALSRLDAANQYTLLTGNDFFPAEKLPLNFHHQSMPFSDRLLTILWHRLHLPLYADRWSGGQDIFHSPNFVLPPLRRAKSLLTVHDLSFIRYPDGALPSLRLWLEKAVPASLQRADHILADSESTRRDLSDIYGISPQHITVVGAGVESRFQRVMDAEVLQQVRRRYRLPDRFVLGLGTLEPRKNFNGLIEAFSRAEVEDVHLVVAGGKGWLYDQLFKAAEASPARERIHFTGFVDDADLPALYSLAELFAFPSHYEGFGIPVLEAMACGAPVVCADNSSLPEVAGEAAIYIQSTDTDGLAGALCSLLQDADQREIMVTRGLERVRRFTWEAAAGKLLSVYLGLESGVIQTARSSS